MSSSMPIFISSSSLTLCSLVGCDTVKFGRYLSTPLIEFLPGYGARFTYATIKTKPRTNSDTSHNCGKITAGPFLSCLFQKYVLPNQQSCLGQVKQTRKLHHEKR